MASDPVRVLLLIDTLGRAGAERQAQLLALNMPRDRVSFWVGCFRAPEESERAFADRGIPLIRLSNRPRRLWPLVLMPRIASFVGRHRIQVIQGFLPTFDVLVPLARLWAPGVRVSVSRRNVDDQLSPRILRDVRFAGRLAHAIVANSEAVAESVRSLEGDPGKKLRVIPNGIVIPEPITPAERAEARRRFGLKPEDLAICYLSHFRDGKGHLYLPEFAERVLREVPQVRFLLAGDMENNRVYRRNAESFRSSVAAMGLEQHFRCLGIIDESRDLLAATDVSLNLSDVEGMSNSLMESMALGVPVVATDAGGAREMITDGIEGAVVPRGEIAAAASRLVALATDPGARARAGEAGRARIAREFSIERMVDAYARLYEELAGR
jgi:glycosyltransferase involved in cell wall biosynthesis